MRLRVERILGTATPSIHITKVIATGGSLLPVWIFAEGMSRRVNFQACDWAIVTGFTGDI
jgi:hypothetical protein